MEALQPIYSVVRCGFFLIFVISIFLPKAGFCQLPLGFPGLGGGGLPLIGSAQPNSQTSISSQLLYLKASGEVGAESPVDSILLFILGAPVLYNNTLKGPAAPAWVVDPQFQVLASHPDGADTLFTGSLGIDTALYPDNPNYNLNTLSGQIQFNFTDKGLQFNSAPFLAYKTEFSVPAGFSGHAWVNDFEAGFNFNDILGTQGDPFTIGLNPGVSQRWIQIDDVQGNESNSGSSALEVEMPITSQIFSGLTLILDPVVYARYYDFHQDAANQGRWDEALSFPVYLDWTLSAKTQWQLLALAVYTDQVSSVAGQDIAQLSTGLEMQKYF